MKKRNQKNVTYLTETTGTQKFVYNYFLLLMYNLYLFMSHEATYRKPSVNIYKPTNEYFMS